MGCGCSRKVKAENSSSPLIGSFIVRLLVPSPSKSRDEPKEEKKAEALGPATKQYNENRQRYSMKSTLWELTEPLKTEGKQDAVLTRKTT